MPAVPLLAAARIGDFCESVNKNDRNGIQITAVAALDLPLPMRVRLLVLSHVAKLLDQMCAECAIPDFTSIYDMSADILREARPIRESVFGERIFQSLSRNLAALSQNHGNRAGTNYLFS